MKKTIALILMTVMLLGLCACDGGRGKNAATGSDLTWKQIEKQADKLLEAEG